MTAPEWSTGETEVLTEAIGRAPSILNIQPWSLEMRGDEVLLHERADVALPYHDPLGRDRVISCGAAVANTELAIRVLGRHTAMSLLPDEGQPTLIARLTVTGPGEPSGRDRELFRAIPRRTSHRKPFAHRSVPDEVADRLVEDSAFAGVHADRLRGRAELTALADELTEAARIQQADRGYQRERALWTIRDEDSHRHGAGIARSALPETGGQLPWVGLVRPLTDLPDRETLIGLLESETVLLFSSEGDGRLDHVRTGIAMQRTWLAAVAAGLAAAVQTQPLHLPPIRDALTEKLDIDGCPQLLMRVGYPSGTVPPTPRRSATDLLGGTDTD
ncbi:nitroreductase family protein [Saccharomonospora marina XMU15]|uniref:Nitroreductase family protein n=1 Tax=Saccharomonospora marina XMU15 TaxID=882083 RepID=H5X0R2_9PSEU|nr:nitroreductase family protein [Saccharomonospora marina]EHR50858.1 nitroreductase family protein [Saccharomonospora marina XMU15]